MQIAVMLGKYLRLWIMRAAENSVMLTDKLSILILPFSTLVLWVTGTKMTNTVQETLALGVAITVMAVVILRLLAASYWIWRDDQTEKRRLRAVIEAPRRETEADLKRYAIEKRKELSAQLAKLSAIANLKAEHLPITGITSFSINQLVLEIDTLINQLSYNVPVRIASIHLKDFCLNLITGAESNRKRLWTQRKLTFRILHMEDEVSDLYTLIEIEALIEQDTGILHPFGQDLPIFENIKKQIRILEERKDRGEIIRRLKAERDLGWDQ